MSNSAPPSLIAIGKVIKPHGLKGEVKILFYDGYSGLMPEDNNVWLQADNQPVKFLTVETYSLKGPHPRIKFHDIHSREDAELLRNLEICIDGDQLPAPDSKDYLLIDLIGLMVIDDQGNELGIIEDTYSLPANDVIEIKNNGKDVLIPMIDDIIKLIDFEDRTVTITVMEGLLDL